MMILLIGLSAPVSLWITLSIFFYKTEEYEYPSIKKGRLLSERTRSYSNFFALFLNIRDGYFPEDIKKRNHRMWKPKSAIDKEIAENEKEISELEKHKEKMDTLAELERRKERLFKDVHGVEQPTNPDQIVYDLKTCDNCGVEIQARVYSKEKPNQYYCSECESWVGNGTVKSEDKFYYRRWSND